MLRQIIKILIIKSTVFTYYITCTALETSVMVTYKKKKNLHTLELKQLDNNKKYYNNMVCPGWTGWLF